MDNLIHKAENRVKELCGSIMVIFTLAITRMASKVVLVFTNSPKAQRTTASGRMESITARAPTSSLTAVLTQDNGKMASSAEEDKKKK